jgi:hypothetical protein
MRTLVVALLIVALVSLVVTAATLDDLRRALAWPWNETYRRDVYDCSNLATFVAAYLQEVKGFDTEVLFSEEQGHAWVRVKNVEGRHRVVETTSSPLAMLGYIISDAWLYRPGSSGINYNLYDGAYEWYDYMNRPEKDYNDLYNAYEKLRQKYNRLLKQYNDLLGEYNRLRR